MVHKAVSFISLTDLFNENEISLLGNLGSISWGSCAHSLVSVEVLAAAVDNMVLAGLPMARAFRALEQLDAKAFVDLET